MVEVMITFEIKSLDGTGNIKSQPFGDIEIESHSALTNEIVSNTYFFDFIFQVPIHEETDISIYSIQIVTAYLIGHHIFVMFIEMDFSTDSVMKSKIMF